MNVKATNLKVFPNEHKISHWLREKGYTRRFIAKELGVDYKRLRMVLSKPDLFLTMDQYKKISYLVQKPFLDVFFEVYGASNIKREARKKWFEEQTPCF